MSFDRLALGKYATIVADPPWRYRTTSQTRSATQRIHPGVVHHYSTMSFEEIADLPVRDLAAGDAHLYLWATTPLLFGEDATKGIGPAEILRRWGFRYVTLLTWVKRGGRGLGYHFRGHTEHVLFGVRGRLPILPADRKPNVFEAPRRGHSVKPPIFYDLVESVSPEPRVELFARQPRLGWDSWGWGE